MPRRRCSGGDASSVGVTVWWMVMRPGVCRDWQRVARAPHEFREFTRLAGASAERSVAQGAPSAPEGCSSCTRTGSTARKRSDPGAPATRTCRATLSPGTST